MPRSAAVAQSVERHIGNVEVTGPIPVSSSYNEPGMLEKRFGFFNFIGNCGVKTRSDQELQCCSRNAAKPLSCLGSGRTEAGMIGGS